MRSRGATGLRGDERSVSEIVGYILVFALIFTTIGFISIGGIPTLDSARESEQLQNAERAFDVLNSNMAEVHERGAPSRATELSADDATVQTGDPVTFNVTVSEGGEVVDYVEADINPIVFAGLGETEFAYEAGAVIRDQPDHDVMLRDPPFKFGEKRVTVPLFQTFNNDGQSAGGGTVLVRATSVTRAVPISDATTDAPRYDSLNITVENSPRANLWERYFEQEHDLDCTQGATLECEFDIEDSDVTQTFVTVQGIQIELEI